MLNPASKTFSIRRLQGMCKTSPHAQGISFVPPSAPKFTPVAALRPTKSAMTNSQMPKTGSTGPQSTTLGGFAVGK